MKSMFLIIILTVLLVISGCSGSTTSATTPTPTVTPTSAPTATPTPSPTPTPEGLTVDQLLAEAPEISGLSKEIENEKVVYKAVEGNEYGIEAGEFAGEYNPNVSIEEEKVGGVILEPEVITKIMGDKSEIIPPLDITGVTAETGLNIVNTTDSLYGEYLGKKYQTLLVEFNGQLEFINPFVEKNQFNTIGTIGNSTYIKDSEEIIDFKNEEGIVPFLALAAQHEGRTEMGMADYYYVFDVENTEKIDNFNESKIYEKGEKTGVLIDSYLAVYYDWIGMQETTTENLARIDAGAVIFTCPQDISEVSS